MFAGTPLSREAGSKAMSVCEISRPTQKCVNPFNLEAGFSEEAFRGLLLAVHVLDFSDVSIISGRPIWGKRHGFNQKLTTRILQDAEVRTTISWMYGANGVTEIMKGHALDPRYEVQITHSVADWCNKILQEFGLGGLVEKTSNQSRKIPFRMNAVGAYTPKGRGFSVSLRTIPMELPLLEHMGLPNDLEPHINQSNGMTLVCGETGSGKSTLLAAIMHDKMLNFQDRKIATIEKPIEFNLQGVASDSNYVVQHEVGPDVSSFYQGVVNCLRQAPTDIMVGEARDMESISALIQATETGHATYATIHSYSVDGCILRIANEFDLANQSQIIFKILSQVRLIVVQRLIKAKSGGRRVPVREWLVFDDRLRRKLMGLSSDNALELIRQTIVKNGHSMRQQALSAYKDGLIGVIDLKAITGDLTADERSEVNLEEDIS